MPHIHELIDFTVEVFIVYQDKVLLRKHDKYNKWLSVGGHIELNEDPTQAATREVKEEIGLDVKLYDGNLAKTMNNEKYHELIPPFFMNIHTINDVHKHIALTYFASSTSNNLLQPETEERGECVWFTKEEIEGKPDLEDHIKYYALKALELLSE